MGDLQASETEPNCSGGYPKTGVTGECRDASLEEVLHLITAKGVSPLYKSKFDEENSELTNAMDKARGGKFTEIPSPYPAGAWYTYKDKTCDYRCMSTEYFYWLLTTINGSQVNRKGSNDGEWYLSTIDEVKARDMEGYNIITKGNKMIVLSEQGKSPDGNYRPTKAKNCQTTVVIDTPSTNFIGLGSERIFPGIYFILILIVLLF